MVVLLRLIDVNAGGFRLKKGQGILHPTIRIYTTTPFRQEIALKDTWGTRRDTSGKFPGKAAEVQPQSGKPSGGQIIAVNGEIVL